MVDSMAQREGSLWMGDVSEYMHEEFIKSAFKAMDEEVLYVKIIRNKYTGLCAGYCFVHFRDEQTALRVMHKLNGKMMPHSHPPVRFMLNHSNANKNSQEREYSLWVGDLDMSVDDAQLYKAFATRYNTVRAARVVYDKASQTSRGYAFVRFGSKDEHKDALTHMNGFTGLANKAIRVSLAVPRKFAGSTPQQHQASMASQPAADGSAGGDYSAYYEQYWYNYHAWQNYAAYNPSAYQAEQTASGGAGDAGSDADDDKDVVDDDVVAEHDLPVDVDRLNRECVQRSEEFWDALDASRWLQPDTLNLELGVAVKT